jgi:hypothetical protein
MDRCSCRSAPNPPRSPDPRLRDHPGASSPPSASARVFAASVLAARVLAARVLAARVLAARVLAARVLAARVLAARVLAARVLAAPGGLPLCVPSNPSASPATPDTRQTGLKWMILAMCRVLGTITPKTLHTAQILHDLQPAGHTRNHPHTTQHTNRTTAATLRAEMADPLIRGPDQLQGKRKFGLISCRITLAGS